jgi:hypothetical protein
MKKTNFLWAILNSIFLVVFNVLFFVLGGTEHNTSVWMSYAFIHFAYFMLLLTPKLVDKRKNPAVFGYSLYSISSIYFLVQFFTGVVFILVAPECYKAALSVQLCIAGLYGIILVSYLIANEYTASAEEKRQPEIAYVKNASLRLKGLLERINDKETKKSVERVYDAIYSSPVKSHPDLAEKESQILESVDELESVVTTGDKEKIISITSSLLALISERNNLLKTLH